MKIRTVTAAIGLAGFFMAMNSAQASAQSADNPDPAPVQVTVAPGDSLSKIATEHQTTYTRLYDANAQIAHPDIIHPGWVVRVPADEESLASRPLPADATDMPAPADTPRATAAVQTAAPRTIPAPAVADGAVWDRLAQCEASGNWAINTGNGFRGGLQFTDATWSGYGGAQYAPYAHLASREQQIDIATRVLARQGWNAWPACSAKLGLR